MSDIWETCWIPETPAGEADEWLLARFGRQAVWIDDIREADPPGSVRAWLRRRDDSLAAFEAKAHLRPLEMAPSHHRWRMFGGEWIDGELLAMLPLAKEYRAAHRARDLDTCWRLALEIYEAVKGVDDE